MTYSDKREFAARVFAALIASDYWTGDYNGQADCIIKLLAQAQLDALPSGDDAHGCDAVWDSYDHSPERDRIDAAYALAVKLAPLVGVEAEEGE